VQTPLYRLCVYRWFGKIVEVYEVVGVTIVAVDVRLRLLVERTAVRWDCGLITMEDCDEWLYFVRCCPHTWQHSLDVCDEAVSAPTKAQQRVILPRHRGGGRRARTPVGWLCMEMRILS
jgi:hypothetical protein